MSENRRKFPRVKIYVPVSYNQLDSQGKAESEHFGVALDVSVGGLLLKSFDFVTSEFIDISFIDIDEQLAQIKCKMVYSRKTDKGLVHTGLAFQGSDQERLDFIGKMIRAFFYRENTVSQVSTPDRKAPPPQTMSTPAGGVVQLEQQA